MTRQGMTNLKLGGATKARDTGRTFQVPASVCRFCLGQQWPYATASVESQR